MFVVVELATVEDRVLHRPDTIKRQDLVVFTPIGWGIDSHDWSFIDGLRDSVDEEDEESKFRVQGGSNYWNDGGNTYLDSLPRCIQE